MNTVSSIFFRRWEVGESGLGDRASEQKVNICHWRTTVGKISVSVCVCVKLVSSYYHKKKKNEIVYRLLLWPDLKTDLSSWTDKIGDKREREKNPNDWNHILCAVSAHVCVRQIQKQTYRFGPRLLSPDVGQYYTFMPIFHMHIEGIWNKRQNIFFGPWSEVLCIVFNFICRPMKFRWLVIFWHIPNGPHRRQRWPWLEKNNVQKRNRWTGSGSSVNFTKCPSYWIPAFDCHEIARVWVYVCVYVRCEANYHQICRN